MQWNLLVALVGSSANLVPSVAAARGDGHEHVFPERNDDAAMRATSWRADGDWELSTPEAPQGGGTRVAAIFTARTDRPIGLQARGLVRDAAGRCNDAAGAGPWVTMDETFGAGEVHVAVRDLDGHFDCAQLRMPVLDSAEVEDLQWELVVPRYPDAGRRSRELSTSVDPQLAIDPELQTIGVISREEWGARATQCSAVESDWYRMAIHHTAGPQTAGGTVVGRLQSTQAYAMDSGTWCDIPYQMLVGFDGTLYEGRGLVLTSGATGGGNNGGNLAVCFIGCYHAPDSACVGGEGHDVTDAMMQQGQLLVQTLVRLHDIATSDDNIRGHRDWPGNSTACPGSLLHPRLGELRADLAWFSASETERSWDETGIEVPVGQTQTLWIDLENTGGLTWQPGETFLAPTDPRDAESVLYDASWPTPTRAATVSEPVPPGAIGRFAFDVRPQTEAETVQAFGLVHEGVTWFADTPWGGGPADDIAIVRVVGVAGDPEDSTGPEDPEDPAGTEGPIEPEDPASSSGADGTDSGQDLPPGFGEGDDGGGCGCAAPASPRSLAGAALLLCVAAGRRRRSR